MTVNSLFVPAGMGGMCDSETDATSVADEYADLTQLFEDPNRTSQEVVRSVFDIKRNEAHTYLVLLEHPNSKISHLSDIVDQHSSHTARALRGLHDAGLVKRTKRNFETGGTGWIYTPVPVEEMKQYLQEQLDEWVAHLRNEIETLDSDIKAELACDGGSDGCSHNEDE
jgi:predicted transcriptional regulator